MDPGGSPRWAVLDWLAQPVVAIAPSTSAAAALARAVLAGFDAKARIAGALVAGMVAGISTHLALAIS